MDRLVARIALYPDPLLAQVLAAATYSVEIVPVNPAVIYVPYYDPLIVFARPRPGFVVSRGITFSFGIAIGPAFRPWGWGGNRIIWNSHTVIINNAEWRRGWANRASYAHPYAIRRPGPPPRIEERHELRERTERERAADRNHRHVEEHRQEQRQEGRSRRK